MGRKIEYKEGQKIGELIYIKDAPSEGKERKALFKCECGNEFVTQINNVKSGNTKSCGRCDNVGIERHGSSRSVNGNATPEYRAWNNMKDRCYNPNYAQYHNYGDRGIKVCDRWLSSFAMFLEDMGLKPSRRHSLDRIDVDGDYCPENCRWATPKEQSRNRKNNLTLKYNGESKTLIEWAEDTGINYVTLQKRVLRGWSDEKVITTPVNKNFSPIKHLNQYNNDNDNRKTRKNL